jgi:hypothetical protein
VMRITVSVVLIAWSVVQPAEYRPIRFPFVDEGVKDKELAALGKTYSTLRRGRRSVKLGAGIVPWWLLYCEWKRSARSA